MFGIDGHSGLDFTILGIPFEGPSAPLGPVLAPASIRGAAARYGNSSGSASPIMVYNPERGYLLKEVSLGDVGDVPRSSSRLEVERHVDAAWGQLDGSRPAVLGGDHFVSYPVVRRIQGPLTVIHFDAHGDLLDDFEASPHGSVMRAISSLENVSRVIHVGLRGNLNTGEGIAWSQAQGNLVFTTTDCLHLKPEQIYATITPGERLYLTFDVDVLDPSVAPGTGTPEPGGIDYRTAIDLVTGFVKRGELVGFDIVEVNPNLDVNDHTSLLAANLFIEVMGSWSIDRHAKDETR